MSYDVTLDHIARVLDEAALGAADIFLADARKNLAPFNLSRHRIQFELEEVVVHAKRADGRAETRYAYELSRISEVSRAIQKLNTAFNKLPGIVRRHLAGTTL